MNYDGGADVLYLSFPNPTPSTCIEAGNGVLIRVNPDNKALTGITIINFKKRTHQK